MSTLETLKAAVMRRISSQIGLQHWRLKEAADEVLAIWCGLQNGKLTPEAAMLQTMTSVRKMNEFMSLQTESQLASLTDLIQCMQIVPDPPAIPFAPVQPELLEKFDKPTKKNP